MKDVYVVGKKWPEMIVNCPNAKVVSFLMASLYISIKNPLYKQSICLIESKDLSKIFLSVKWQQYDRLKPNFDRQVRIDEAFLTKSLLTLIFNFLINENSAIFYL